MDQYFFGRGGGGSKILKKLFALAKQPKKIVCRDERKCLQEGAIGLSRKNYHPPLQKIMVPPLVYSNISHRVIEIRPCENCHKIPLL